ncbi:putative methyltransferase [Vibrio ichthyoenteri ATCC 700023]|uniref:Putative methyltransferase n=1 Tax=Vibrio ichthyoenteri ATCC 700023 TaxID=870968 RepID=F9S7P2_9VIBR|nr:methyltransferase domain-containing protein [Vibrio ichthyoenteri]EGU31060.1 putative methyltransferase [Vibrio ichthyoenteri ATCC 700023]
MADSVKLLSSEQTQAFDTEYVDDSMFDLVIEALDKYQISQAPFKLMDVGGGNGKYVDKVLNHFARASAILVEPEPSLAQKNRPDERKQVLQSTFQSLALPNRLQAVQFNWVLHHFVTEGYQNTCRVQQQALRDAYKVLAPGGIVLIFENFYEGALIEDLPSQLIYHLTSSKVLAPLTEKLGANTAGVGVCFHSARFWRQQLTQAGFANISEHHCYDFSALSRLKRIGLTLEKQRVGLLVAQKPPLRAC